VLSFRNGKGHGYLNHMTNWHGKNIMDGNCMLDIINAVYFEYDYNV